MNLETRIQNEIRLVLANIGCVTWRNNTGYATSERVKYGLCNGSADLIGIAPYGIFLAIEVKRPGQKPTRPQRRFLDAVNQAGGIGICADSAASAVKQVMDRLHYILSVTSATSIIIPSNTE